MQELLFVLWFFWPAGVAILIPVLAAHTPGLTKWTAPMDGGRTYKGKRLLGDNKTWRGFVTGTLAGLLWFAVQMWWYDHSSYVQAMSPLDYTTLTALLVGLAVSGGALIGDAVASFFKRQLEVAPGKSWFPWDQIDFIIGGMLLSLPFVQLPLWVYVLTLPVWIGIHLIFGALGYVFKFKDSVI
ncbi:CDP-2,3-bis-(O-geranylgeranyl)-sn-glycerol synthase [soil metagenome]